jgi:hypothetical protein
MTRAVTYGHRHIWSLFGLAPGGACACVDLKEVLWWPQVRRFDWKATAATNEVVPVQRYDASPCFSSYARGVTHVCISDTLQTATVRDGSVVLAASTPAPFDAIFEAQHRARRGVSWLRRVKPHL